MEQPRKKSIGEDTVNTLLMPFFKERTHEVVHPFKPEVKEPKEKPPFYIQVFDYTVSWSHFVTLQPLPNL